jgi:hypothetical protein
MRFLMVDGRGDPNISAAYKAAVEALYTLSYSIKMSKMSGETPEGYFDFVVPPLEGLWEVDDAAYAGGAIADKSKFIWRAMLRVPEFVTSAVLATAKTASSKKKPDVDTALVRLSDFTEGLCVQIMHIGSYDDEPPTIARMDGFSVDSGYKLDFSETRRHHEIYIGDPRKVAPSKLKTAIRHPIRRAK